jgi:murein DD-endopeptidase MepM/ murein hydrolase activator NlpD
MVRAHRASTWVDAVWRLLAPVLVVALALSIGAAAPAPVAADSSSGNVATIRQAQRNAEIAMRRVDRQIDRLQRQRRHHARLLKAAKRKLDTAIKARNKAHRKADRSGRRLDEREQVLARALRVHPDPRGKQATDKPALRKRVRKLKVEVRRLQKQARTATRKVERARDLKQARARKIGKARIAARKAERERAEDKLAARISQMLALSKERASQGIGPASTRGFMKPASGTISQPYGCTGYVANKRHGSCAHFHDGVDIATRRGTKVRASADGYVAYVGFNPWDVGSRAFVVIIGHSGGYESVYAHLMATRKVRAGQRVKRGDVIGVVGMTGHTSGPHVHWEVSRNRQTLNPFRAGR